MTAEQALRIIIDRRGTQYDPKVVDAFVACHERIMPPRDVAPLPSSRRPRPRRRLEEGPAIGGDGATDALLALASLSRALAGDAQAVRCRRAPVDAAAADRAGRRDGALPAGRDQRSRRHPLCGRPPRRRDARRDAPDRDGDRGMDGGEPPARAERRALARPRNARRVPRPRCGRASWCRSSRATRSSRCWGSTRRTPPRFTEDHLRLLEVLGSRLAAALVDAAIADEDSQQCSGRSSTVVETRADQLMSFA